MGLVNKMISKIMLGVLVVGVTALSAEEYSFTVENSTKTKITQVLVSEDGKTWGKFDIGQGIKPHETVTLIWDESTNDEDCKQHVKAVWSDRSESESAIFDFCEDNLELVF